MIGKDQDTKEITERKKEKGRRTNAPACGIKVLARRSHRQGDLLDFRRQGSDTGEGDVVKPIVDLIGQDDNLVLEAEIGDPLQLIAGKYLANGVVFFLVSVTELIMICTE